MSGDSQGRQRLGNIFRNTKKRGSLEEGAVRTDTQDKLEEGPRRDTGCHFYSNS